MVKATLDFRTKPLLVVFVLALAVGIPFRVLAEPWFHSVLLLAATGSGYLVCEMLVVSKGDRLVVGFSKRSVMSFGALCILTGAVDREPLWTVLLGFTLGIFGGGLWKARRIERDLEAVAESGTFPPG